MSNGIDFTTTPGVGRVLVAGSWINENGRLPVCIAKTPLRVDEIVSNSIAAGTSDFARAIFETDENGVSRIQGWFGGEAGLLVFPEYAFSSQEFSVIDACVREHPTRLIVLGGCGAVSTADVQELLQNGCSAGWPSDTPLAEFGRYNLGWCWIHESPGNTRCVLFAKNYIDQVVEIAEIPNLQTIQGILCIETNDLVIHPLICSDLISEQANGPRVRIAQAPSNGKRLLVCTISCNSAPESERWRTAIDNVVQIHQQQAVLIFANQAVATPQPDEERDRWRCLTGTFINRARMPHAPRTPLPSMRHVLTQAASGLLFRQPDVGIAAGLVNWDHADSATGLYVWEPRWRLRWSNGLFQEMADSIESYETRRFVRRRCREMVANFAQNTQSALAGKLDELASRPDSVQITPRLWPDLLNGLDPLISGRSADEMYRDETELDLAFGVFAAIDLGTNGQWLAATEGRGQIHWDGRDIRVWRSPSLRADQMFAECQRLALSGGSAPPLIVVGRGIAIGAHVAARIATPFAQRAIPNRLTDISSAVDEGAGNIESPRPRQVYWQPMGTIEQALITAVNDFALQVCRAITDQLELD